MSLVGGFECAYKSFYLGSYFQTTSTVNDTTIWRDEMEDELGIKVYPTVRGEMATIHLSP